MYNIYFLGPDQIKKFKSKSKFRKSKTKFRNQIKISKKQNKIKILKKQNKISKKQNKIHKPIKKAKQNFVRKSITWKVDTGVPEVTSLKK